MISIESSGGHHTNSNTEAGWFYCDRTRNNEERVVEAVGVTAAGFFVSPVPQQQLHALPERTNVTGEGDDADGEEEERVNVAERRRMFENSTAG